MLDNTSTHSKTESSKILGLFVKLFDFLCLDFLLALQ